MVDGFGLFGVVGMDCDLVRSSSDASISSLSLRFFLICLGGYAGDDIGFVGNLIGFVFVLTL